MLPVLRAMLPVLLETEAVVQRLPLNMILSYFFVCKSWQRPKESSWPMVTLIHFCLLMLQQLPPIHKNRRRRRMVLANCVLIASASPSHAV